MKKERKEQKKEKEKVKGVIQGERGRDTRKMRRTVRREGSKQEILRKRRKNYYKNITGQGGKRRKSRIYIWVRGVTWLA